MDRYRLARQDRQGEATRGTDWLGEARQDRQGTAGTGNDTTGSARHSFLTEGQKMVQKVTDSRKDLVIAALERCRDKDGIITREAVFEAAKNPNNILHTRPEFKWDKDKAWEAYNLDAAARVIRSVKVQIVVKSHKMVVPIYVNHPSTSKPGAYVKFEEVKSNALMAHGIILAEMSRVENALRRAMAISCALDLKPEFEAMLKQVLSMQDKVKDAGK